MKIISQAVLHEETEHSLFFEYEDMVGAGFSFSCSEDGVVIDPNHENYIRCLSGTISGRRVKKPVVETSSWSYVSPAVGQCVCGEEVELDRFTNTCSNCFRDYNKSGQELGPREQWGEETGESLSDILRIK